MRWFKEVVAITSLNLRTVPQRLGSSGVAIVGIAGVVVVLVAVLSIAEGFSAAMRGAGAPDRAMVMRSGADSEMTSGLGGPEVEIIKQAPGIVRDGQNVVASSELFVIIDLPKRSTGTSANVPLRGIEPTAMNVRQGASIVEGRMFKFGTNEVIAGRAAAGQFSGLQVGSTIRSGQLTWQVVGLFEADGSVAETELWCDARTLQGAYRRGNSYQSVVARLDSPDSFEAFKTWLSSNPQVNVSVQRETDYYSAQSVTLTNLIRTIGFGIAALMAIGAVFGAILTMYTAVASRSREIATLRALGFNAGAVLVSVLAESLTLAALGGIAGGLGAYAAFNGYQTSTINFQTFSQVAFAFRVTPQLLVLGVVWSLFMGLFGGLLPAVRAARLPITSALRGALALTRSWAALAIVVRALTLVVRRWRSSCGRYAGRADGDVHGEAVTTNVNIERPAPAVARQTPVPARRPSVPHDDRQCPTTSVSGRTTTSVPYYQRMPILDRIPLRRLFALIVLTEVVTLVALYWFGKHFV